MTNRGMIQWAIALLFGIAWLVIGNETASAVWIAASLIFIHMEYLNGR
jgi:hypothetical protein